MTTFTPPGFSAFLQPLRQLARRWPTRQPSVRRRRPPRREALAQPRTPPAGLWKVDHTELQQALERSWH
jgi:hypothetical protein